MALVITTNIWTLWILFSSSWAIICAVPTSVVDLHLLCNKERNDRNLDLFFALGQDMKSVEKSYFRLSAYQILQQGDTVKYQNVYLFYSQGTLLEIFLDVEICTNNSTILDPSKYG